MVQLKISEMTVGQNVEGRLVVAGATVRNTKSNPPRPFLSATLTDGTDTVECVFWNYIAARGVPEAGKVYDITGSVGEYNGKKQLTLTDIVLSGNQDVTEFSCTYDGDLEGLWMNALSCIDCIRNDTLRGITSHIYHMFKDDILRASSAKAVHHVGIGGNLCHAIEVFDYARSIAKLVTGHGLQVDESLVAAGALLHDIGKIFTYEVNGAVVDFTIDGRLFDHIGLGVQLLTEVQTALGPEYVDCIRLLQHIILSHHGQLELGSPVTPKFAEAYIVNIADGISARMDTLRSANMKAEAEGKPFTDRIFALGNHEHILQREVNALLWSKN